MVTINVSRMIRDVLNQCLTDGMKPPLILCAMSPNGSVLVVRFLGKVARISWHRTLMLAAFVCQ
jgi:hypothetical protein